MFRTSLRHRALHRIDPLFRASTSILLFWFKGAYHLAGSEAEDLKWKQASNSILLRPSSGRSTSPPSQKSDIFFIAYACLWLNESSWRWVLHQKSLGDIQERRQVVHEAIRTRHSALVSSSKSFIYGLSFIRVRWITWQRPWAVSNWQLLRTEKRTSLFTYSSSDYRLEEKRFRASRLIFLGLFIL